MLSLCITIIISMIYSGCSNISTLRSVTDASKIPNVNVLIYKSKKGFSLSSTERYVIRDFESREIIDSVQNGRPITIGKDTTGSLSIAFDNKKTEGYKKILITPAGTENLFGVQDRQYRGQMFVMLLDSEIVAVNTLDLESYVKGVVRNEIGNLPITQIEAAKAQAVAARTYAIRSIGKLKREYDLVSDVYDQVYQGAGSESEVTNKSVAETSGEILEYQGKPAHTYYFSSCGGATANVQDVWITSDTIPYLQSVSNKISDDYLCRDSPHFRWKLSWTGDELEQIIKANLPAVLRKDLPDEDFTKIEGQKLYNVAVLERDSSQRVKKLKIGFQKDAYFISGEQARRVLKGPKYIFYSSLFRLDVERNSDGTLKQVICTGGGFGHGVGMCQWSARKMASNGFNYDDILLFFYRGAKISRLY